jgi:hypothetical protein
MEQPNLIIPAGRAPEVSSPGAGIQMFFSSQEILWTPAFAGVTDLDLLRVLIQVSTASMCCHDDPAMYDTPHGS